MSGEVVRAMSKTRAEAVVTELGTILAAMAVDAENLSRRAIEAVPLLDAVYQSQAWTALGYESFDDLTADRFPALRNLPREYRSTIVGALTAAGWSTRAIGTALGVSRQTVANDQATVNNLTVDAPETVTGLDGRTITRTRRRTITATEVETETITPPPLTPEQRVAVLVRTFVAERKAIDFPLGRDEAVYLVTELNGLAPVGLDLEVVIDE